MSGAKVVLVIVVVVVCAGCAVCFGQWEVDSATALANTGVVGLLIVSGQLSWMSMLAAAGACAVNSLNPVILATSALLKPVGYHGSWLNAVAGAPKRTMEVSNPLAGQKLR